MFQIDLIPTINNPTRITKDKISALYHTIKNSIIINVFETVIVTADIPDLFPVIYTFKLKTKLDLLKNQFLYNLLLTET